MDVREFVREKINKGETQHSFAERCGFSQGLVYKIINTSSPISLETRFKIAKAYQLPFDAFMEDPVSAEYPHGTDKFKQHIKQITEDHVAEEGEELYSEEYREMLKATKGYPIARLAYLEMIKLSEEEQFQYYKKAKAAAQSLGSGPGTNVVDVEKPEQ